MKRPLPYTYRTYMLSLTDLDGIVQEYIYNDSIRITFLGNVHVHHEHHITNITRCFFLFYILIQNVKHSSNDELLIIDFCNYDFVS